MNTMKEDFRQTVQHWKESLGVYSDATFAMKPDPNSWSAGQLYSHLISATQRTFLLIEKCLTGNANSNELKTQRGEDALKTRILSLSKVQVPAHRENPPAQPAGTAGIAESLDALILKYQALADTTKTSVITGKEKHPILGFMNAAEWLETTHLHWQHHVKQKEEINRFLGKSGQLQTKTA